MTKRDKLDLLQGELEGIGERIYRATWSLQGNDLYCVKKMSEEEAVKFIPVALEKYLAKQAEIIGVQDSTAELFE